MRGPLALVIDDGNGPRHVTQRSTGLRFKRSAYGGDVDLTVTAAVPRGTFTDLGPGSSVTVYDARTGGFVWRGVATLPGVTAGPLGESLDLQALGGAARLQSVTDSLAYVHELHGDFRRVDSTKGANVDEQEKNNGTPTLEVSWAKLFELEHDDQGQFACRTFQHNGLKIGRFKADYDAGRDDSDIVLRLMTGTDVDTLSSAASATASTAGGLLQAHVGGAGITVGDDIVGLRVHYNGATLDVHKNASTDQVEGGVPDKTYWARFLNVTVCQLRKDKYGVNLTTGYDTSTVQAQDVIRDMIGRGLCPGLDPDKVTVGTFDYEIDALSWLDGIKMGDALNELLVFEPTLTWQVYGDEGNFDAWPADARYVISDRDGGVNLPGEEVSLANRVFISYLDRRGRQKSVPVVATDAPVGAEGVHGIRLTDFYVGLDYTVDADPIDLSDSSGSDANAERAGEKALELHNNPPRAGSAVIRRPILDRWTGAMVLPHEIMPGCVAVHQETGDEYRVTETDYDDDAGACVLTLGEPRRSIEQVIARLERKQRRKKH